MWGHGWSAAAPQRVRERGALLGWGVQAGGVRRRSVAQTQREGTRETRGELRALWARPRYPWNMACCGDCHPV